MGKGSQLLHQIKHVDVERLRMFSQPNERLGDDKKDSMKTEIKQFEALVEQRCDETKINNLYKPEIKISAANTMIITMNYKYNFAIRNQTHTIGATWRYWIIKIMLHGLLSNV